METTIVKTPDVTIYIHEDDCSADMNTAVQEVAGIIFDIYKRREEHQEGLKERSPQ